MCLQTGELMKLQQEREHQQDSPLRMTTPAGETTQIWHSDACSMLTSKSGLFWRILLKESSGQEVGLASVFPNMGLVYWLWRLCKNAEWLSAIPKFVCFKRFILLFICLCVQECVHRDQKRKLGNPGGAGVLGTDELSTMGDPTSPVLWKSHNHI